MGLFDFFRKNRGTDESAMITENPSPEQTAFADAVLATIGPTVEKFGFRRIEVDIETYWTRIIFCKDKQYINILSTSYPTDYPNYYDIIFSEGKRRKSGFYWRSITTLRLAKIIDPSITAFTYNFPFGDLIKVSVETANEDLLKYGASFLKGDLSIFYQAQKVLDQEIAAYEFGKTGDLKTSKFDKSGVYQIRES
jgi:hypothetical protein